MMTDKQLRQNIMAIASGLGWDYEQSHDMFESWGYGRSLRSMTRHNLFDLRDRLKGIQSVKRQKAFVFDKRGKKMYSLLKQAGWDMPRLNRYMIKRYRKTHWNLLDEQEQEGVMAMLRNYARKNGNLDE